MAHLRSKKTQRKSGTFMFLKKIFIPVLFLGLADLGLAVETTVNNFKTDQVKSLILDNGSGNTIMTGKQTTELSISAQKTKWATHCKLEINQEGDKVKVSVNNQKSNLRFTKDECQVDFKIIVPTKLNITVNNGSGNVDINNVRGEFDFAIGSGNLQMEKCEALKIEAKIGSGDLILDGSITKANIKVGSGNLKLIYKELPSTGELQIRSGSGDTTVLLPKDSKIKTEFSAGSGKISNDFGNSDKAQYSIIMHAGSGNLKIKRL